MHPFLAARLLRLLALLAIVTLAWRVPLFLLGVVLFAAISFLLTPWWPSGTALPDGQLAVILAAFVVLAILPWTRFVGLGFLVGLLLATVTLDGTFARPWWRVVDDVASAVMRPAREAARRRAGEGAWLAAHRDAPMDVDAGAWRIRQLAERMVRRGLEGRTAATFPSAMELTEPDDYRGARGDALEIEAGWPGRYGKGDTGWRWTLAPSATPAWWGGPGFLLAMRPDPALQRDGPILELDGQALLRIRDRAGAPSRVVRTPIPVLRRLRECLLQAGAAVGADTLRWKYLPESSELRRACRDLYIKVSSSVGEDGSLELSVMTKAPEGSVRLWSEPTFVGYRYLAPGRFELRASEQLRRYLLSADDTLHVTAGPRQAQPTDPPPLPCELEPAAPCG